MSSVAWCCDLISHIPSEQVKLQQCDAAMNDGGERLPVVPVEPVSAARSGLEVQVVNERSVLW